MKEVMNTSIVIRHFKEMLRVSYVMQGMSSYALCLGNMRKKRKLSFERGKEFGKSKRTH